MKKRLKRTDEKLRQGAKSVNYEIKMLLGTMTYRSDPLDPIMSNMILESFLVHVRNLFEFLFKRMEKHGDEVRSAQFITDDDKNKIWRVKQKEFEDILQDEMGRIHKRLAHISYDRDSCDRGWVKVNLVIELRNMMQSFINHVPEDKKRWFEIDGLLKFEIPENGPQVVYSTYSIQGVASSTISSSIPRDVNERKNKGKC